MSDTASIDTDVSSYVKTDKSALIQLKQILPVAVAFNVGLYIRGKRAAFQIDFQEHGVFREGGMNPKSFEYIIRTFLKQTDPELEKRTLIFDTSYGQVVCDKGNQSGSMCALMNTACTTKNDEKSMDDCKHGVGKLLDLKCPYEDWGALGKNFRVYFEVFDRRDDIPKRVGEHRLFQFDDSAPRSSANPIFMAQMCTSGTHIQELFDQIKSFVDVAGEMKLELMRMEINIHPRRFLDATPVV